MKQTDHFLFLLLLASTLPLGFFTTQLLYNQLLYNQLLYNQLLYVSALPPDVRRWLCPAG
jgi:hypothetical protein